MNTDKALDVSRTAEESEDLGNASQPSTAINFDVPRGACDCITHIFGDPVEWPMASTRTYTPETASIPAIQALERSLHVDRVIIVQPTIYGTDNACTMDAVKRLGEKARGVAVTDENTPREAFDEMDRAGFCGVRINLGTIGMNNPEVARQRLKVAIEQVGHRPNWHIQIYTHPPVIEAIHDLLLACPVPLAFDHFGGVKVSEPSHQGNGLALLLELIRSGKAYVKFSAPYLASKLKPDFSDVIPLAKTFIETNRERVLWGTNWPHPNAALGENRNPTELTPLRRVDDGHILNLLPSWAPDEADRKMILVDNAARLYGF